MKQLFIILLLAGPLISRGQLIDVKEAARRKTENRVNNKTDNSVDKGLDKVEEGIGNLFKKKKKKTESGEPQDGQSIEKKGNPGTATAPAAGDKNFKSYSKFDFVSGEKLLYYDDFSRVAPGDFPAEFNTDASGEVVTIDGKAGKWLNLTKNGSFVPENIKALPDNFTLELTAGIQGDPTNNYYGFGFNFNTDKDKLMTYRFTTGSFVLLHPGAQTAGMSVEVPGSPVVSNEFQMPQWNVAGNTFARISLWRQKGRLRLYINETKLMDIPRFFAEDKPYYISFFRDFFDDCNFFISDIKYAAGEPDTRSKLITQGKFSTTGILFDVNSDKIQSSSYGTLKEIATVLKDNAGVAVKIIGHTDSDGDEKANLALSQKRAAAVKNILTSEFGIDASLMQTDGKGETVPAEPNTTSQGKASNRRVEFIKL